MKSFALRANVDFTKQSYSTEIIPEVASCSASLMLVEQSPERDEGTWFSVEFDRIRRGDCEGSPSLD